MWFYLKANIPTSVEINLINLKRASDFVSRYNEFFFYKKRYIIASNKIYIYQKT